VEPELGLRDDPEVAAATAKPPEQLGVLILARADDLAGRGDELGSDQVVAGEAALRGQVADPSSKGETVTPVEPTTPPGVTRPWA
jgi:hypothetical protein